MAKALFPFTFVSVYCTCICDCDLIFKAFVLLILLRFCVVLTMRQVTRFANFPAIHFFSISLYVFLLDSLSFIRSVFSLTVKRICFVVCSLFVYHHLLLRFKSKRLFIVRCDRFMFNVQPRWCLVPFIKNYELRFVQTIIVLKLPFYAMRGCRWFVIIML